MVKDTGGQAFPSVEETYIGGGQTLKNNIEGMTLRDYFAGQALAGMTIIVDTHPSLTILYADRAYAMADAMIAQRNKGEPNDHS